jgi:hypothetical protein
MSEAALRLQKRFKIAAWLLAAGLLVEGVTLQWAHPTSFLLFIILGGLLVGLGVAIYLFALITA